MTNISKDAESENACQMSGYHITEIKEDDSIEKKHEESPYQNRSNYEQTSPFMINSSPQIDSQTKMYDSGFLGKLKSI